MLGHKRGKVTLSRYTGVLDSMSARTNERLDEAFRGLGPATKYDAKVATLGG